MSAIRGVALAGGSSYPAAHLLEVEPLPPVISGLSALDSVVPGIEPGSILAIVGTRGSGVTELALTYAVHAASQQRQRTLVVNGHLGAHALGRRLAALQANQAGTVADELTEADVAEALHRLPAEHLEVASWMPLPTHLPTGDWDWAADPLVSRDLVVYDTVDELPDTSQARFGDERVGALRDLRAASRRSFVSVIVTARLAPVALDGRAVCAAWRRHAMNEAIQDVADVVLTIIDTGDGDVTVRAENRLGHGGLIGLTRDGPHGLFRAAGRHHQAADF
jgi:hypothetical protein